MLKEIFDKMCKEMESYFLQKGTTAKFILGYPSPLEQREGIYIALQDYGIDPLLKNRLPVTDEQPHFSNYAHLLSFFLQPVCAAYERRLQLLETIVEFFEVRPFFEITIGKEQYELAISMKTVTTQDYTQFWIARQQPPEPVLFYQARLSEI